MTTLQQRFDEYFFPPPNSFSQHQFKQELAGRLPAAILAFIKQELNMLAEEVEGKREMQTALNQPGLVDGIRNSVLVEAAAIIRNRIKELKI